jgi:hypothetical protein
MITCFGILEILKIYSCSIDGYLKIWDFKGENVATLNLNHPLPISWKLKEDDEAKFKK